MKKNTIPALLIFSALVVLGLSSCKKSDLVPENNSVGQESTNTTNTTMKVPTYEAGIRSNEGYPADQQTNCGYYRLYSNISVGQQPVVTNYFGGMAGATYPTGIVGFAAGTNIEVYAYKMDNVTIMNYGGSEIPVFLNGNLFTYPIEEIEMNPATNEVYALCKVGNNMQLYRIDNVTGDATLITYNGSANIFNNTLGNGYKSGSITFMLRKDGTYKLIYTTESQVYASLGLVFWVYDIVGNTVQVVSFANRTYTTASSGIPGALTGKINTAYGDGKFYFARDNGNLYSINLYMASNTTGAVTLESATPLVNANDFGYWKNL